MLKIDPTPGLSTPTVPEMNELLARRGYFCCDWWTICHEPDRMRRILSEIVIVRAQEKMAEAVIEYVGFSHLFDIANDPYGITPEYELMLDGERVVAHRLSPCKPERLGRAGTPSPDAKTEAERRYDAEYRKRP